MVAPNDSRMHGLLAQPLHLAHPHLDHPAKPDHHDGDRPTPLIVNGEDVKYIRQPGNYSDDNPLIDELFNHPSQLNNLQIKGRENEQAATPGTSSPPANANGNVVVSEMFERTNNPGEYRIVGGMKAVHIYPWIVSFRFAATKKHFCMGQLIHESWVLTAKHCLEANNKPEIWIGGLDLEKQEEFTIRSVKRIINHPESDVALVEMDTPVKDRTTLNVNHNPSIPVGTMCTVIGWGRTSEGGELARILQQVSLPVIDPETCRKASSGKYNDKFEMCVGVAEGGKDGCQGDSGGPLIVAKNEGDLTTQFLIGVTSWGRGCARAGQYGAWVKTSAVLDFLQKHIPDLPTYDAVKEINGGGAPAATPAQSQSLSPSPPSPQPPSPLPLSPRSLVEKFWAVTADVKRRVAENNWGMDWNVDLETVCVFVLFFVVFVLILVVWRQNSI